MERADNGRFKKKSKVSFIEERSDGNYQLNFQIPKLMNIFCWIFVLVIALPWVIILLNSNILTKGKNLISDVMGINFKQPIMGSSNVYNGDNSRRVNEREEDLHSRSTVASSCSSVGSNCAKPNDGINDINDLD